MEFTVRIQSTTERSIGLPIEQIGLDALDRVRSEIAMPELDMSLLKSNLAGISTDVSLQIIERTARESGLFTERNHVTVCTPPGYLNDFVMTRVIQTRTPDTGEIKEVQIIRQVEKIAILDAWAEAGFPERWGFSEDKDVSE